MPYTCTSCGRYQQGHSADGICPASECQPARQAKAAAAERVKPSPSAARDDLVALLTRWAPSSVRSLKDAEDFAHELVNAFDAYLESRGQS